MKLGLLQCDHVLGELQSVHGDYDSMFERWLGGNWKVYDVVHGEQPQDLAECDAYVSTGSKTSVYDDEPWIHSFADLVRSLHKASKPFLGVCYGHQMIAHALGGKVERSARGWGVGVHEFSVEQKELWMEPGKSPVRLLMSCRDQVEQMPEGAVHLGGNAHCPVGIFRLGTLLGIQGHPEWNPAYAEALLLHRRASIGAEVTAAALSTLTTQTDSDVLRDWAIHFLSSHVAV